MLKRAIILVPGYKRSAHLEARDQLVRSLQYYGDGYQITLETEDIGEGVTGSSGFEAHALTGDHKIEAHVFEAYWNDLVPDWNEQTPLSRFWRATKLIAYWAPGGLMMSIIRGKGIPARASVSLLIAGLGLLFWYATIFVVLLEAISAGDLKLSAMVGDALAGWGIGVTTVAEKITEFMKNWAPYLLVIGLFGVARLEAIANLSDFTRAYLRDAVHGEDGIGLRAKAKQRVVAQLHHVHESSANFDEVFVVAHSMGGPIAIDALAEFGERLKTTTLHTWGTGIGALALQEPQIEAEIRKFYESDARINNWIDVVFRRDMIASAVPVPVRMVPDGEGRLRADNSAIFPPTLHPSMPGGITLDFKELHERYFRCQAAILPLLQPAPPPAFPLGSDADLPTDGSAASA